MFIMKKIKLKLNNKTKIIFSILVIGIIVPTFIVCAFYKPTKLNKYIASTLYKEENNIYFNDNTLYNCIIDAYNKENNTTNPYTYSLSLEELSSIKEVTCRGDELSEEAFKVSDLTGIDKLENLEYLEIPNNFLTEVDLSKNTKLKTLYLGGNQLEALDISNNTLLTDLSVGWNALTKLDVTNNQKLTSLELDYNQLESIDLSQNLDLTKLSLATNKFASVDLSNNTKLNELFLFHNKLSNLDLSNNTLITNLRLEKNNLTYIDLSNNTKLTDLMVDNNQLTTLDLTNNEELQNLSAEANKITNINLENNSNLKIISMDNNSLTDIDLTNINKLEQLYLNNNALTQINLENNLNLSQLQLINNKLTTLDLTKNTQLISLNINGNAFEANNIILFKGKTLEKASLPYPDVSLPPEKTLTLKDITCNENCLTSNENQITVNESGEYTLTLTYTHDLSEEDLVEVKVPLTVIELTSNDYMIDNDNKAIYYLNKEFDINNITFKSGEEEYTNEKLTKEYNGNILTIKYDGSIVNTYNVSKLTMYSDKYTIKDDTIDVLDFTFDKNNIKFKLGEQDFTDEKLTIEYNYGQTIEFTEEQKKRADVNKDGVIDEADVKMLREVIASGTNTLENSLGDVNLDGKVDLKDVLILRMYLYTNLAIKYDGNLIDAYKVNILNLTSADYIIDNENSKLYYGDKTFNIDNVIVKLGAEEYTDEKLTKEFNDSILTIKYDGNVLKTFTVIPVAISSAEYTINSDYIYIGNNTLDLSKISVNIGELNINENTLEIKYNNKVVKTYKIIKTSLSDYIIKDDTIYSLNEEFDINKVSATNAEFVIEDNKLNLKYNDNIIKTYNISKIEISSDYYVITNDSIYIKDNELSVDKITINNATLKQEDSKLKLLIGEETIKEYEIVKVTISSELYDIDGDYIYSYNRNLSSDYITSNIGTVDLTNNKVTIILNDKVIATYQAININSEEYKIGKNYVFIGTNNTLDTSKITTNGVLKLNNDKLELEYNNKLLKTFEIGSVTLGNLKLDKKIITIPTKLSYEDFTKEITTKNTTYKIEKYLGGEEVANYEEITSGDITGGLLLRIYKGSEVVETYSINEGYYKINNLKVDETNKYILDIKDKTSLESFLTNIETSGTVTIKNKDNEEKSNEDLVATGDTIKIDLGTRSITYTLVVKGDVDGDGDVTASDAYKVLQHSIELRKLEGVYLLAGQINGSEDLTAQDAYKILRYSIDIIDNL